MGILNTLYVYVGMIEKAREEVKHITKNIYDSAKDVRDDVAHSKRGFDMANDALKKDIPRIKELFKIGLAEKYITGDELQKLFNKYGDSLQKYQTMKKGKYF